MPEALRRVHLIPAGDAPSEDPETLNANVFRNLDSPVSEGGDNFSTGYACSYCPNRLSLITVQREAAALYGSGHPETHQGAAHGRGKPFLCEAVKLS